MIWVQRIIWVVLTLFSISVIYIVFSGGVVKDDEEEVLLGMLDFDAQK